MTRLPSLGPRGEGWFALQVVLLAGIGFAAAGGAVVAGPLRVAGIVVGAVMVAVGLAVAAWSIRVLRASLTPLPHPRPEGELVVSGPYAVVRHPIYAAIVLGALGWSLVWASPTALVLSVVLFGFFDLKSRREEAWLEAAYPGYAAYRERTRRLIPFVY